LVTSRSSGGSGVVRRPWRRRRRRRGASSAGTLCRSGVRVAGSGPLLAGSTAGHGGALGATTSLPAGYGGVTGVQWRLRVTSGPRWAVWRRGGAMLPPARRLGDAAADGLGARCCAMVVHGAATMAGGGAGGGASPRGGRVCGSAAGGPVRAAAGCHGRWQVAGVWPAWRGRRRGAAGNTSGVVVRRWCSAARVRLRQLGVGVRRRCKLGGVAMVVVLACCTGHVMCRLVDSGRKPSPASAWWSDDDVPDVVLPCWGRHFLSLFRSHEVSG
jgi:hypothetical protein